MADLDCSLVAYDLSLRGRQIAVGLAHRGLDNGNIRISCVILKDGEIIEHQTLKVFSTDQYKLDLTDGSLYLSLFGSVYGFLLWFSMRIIPLMKANLIIIIKSK
jgi:hypothetical protein